MHIGLLTPDLHHRHGWGHYSLSLIHALRRLGVQVTVAAAQNSPTDFDFPVHPILPNLVPAQARQLARLTLNIPATRRALHDCDLIHATAEPYAPLAMWSANNRPYFITGHGSYAQAGVNRHAMVRPLHKTAFLKAHAVICVSQHTARVASAHTPGVNTVVINNGIDVERFTNLPTLPDKPSRPIILTAGGVKARKGTLELVRAVAAVRERVPDVLCVVIGNNTSEAAYLGQVEREIDTLHLRDTVHLLGFVPDEVLLGWYGAADVFVLPAINHKWKFEGFGLVYLEASAAGLPVIGTTENGAEDAIRDGETGLLIPQDAIPEQLPRAIIRLLSDKALARRMGEAGKAFAAHLTWDKAARDLLTLYRATLH